jgi:hypothetical protein
MTAALLNRLTHHCEIFQMNGESCRLRESMNKAGRQAKSPSTGSHLRHNPQ